MKTCYYLFFAALLCLGGCTSEITDKDSFEKQFEESMEPIIQDAQRQLYYRIFVSEDTEMKVDQNIYRIGAEGGTMTFVAYLPSAISTRDGSLKDKLNDFVYYQFDPEHHFQNFTRTSRSDMETVYRFEIGKNISGKEIGTGIVLVDTTGVDVTESCYGRFMIFQEAE